MKNTINFYYNIFLDELIKKDNCYYFYYGGDEYYFVPFNRPYDDVQSIYKLNLEMKKRRCLVHELVLNKDKSIITVVNGISYVLIKLCKYKNDKVFLNDINYIQNMTVNIECDKSLVRNDWIKLWSEKIDYYEYQISQVGKKYPLLCDSLSYFIGMGENAISYLVNNLDSKTNVNLVVSHKRIYQERGSLNFYDPLNFVVDSRVRDVAEFIKETFYNKTLNLYDLKSYFNMANLTKNEYILLLGRLLFPTYYFDIYDDIINKGKSEELVINIIDRTDEYESLLNTIYKFILYEKKARLEPIEWLQDKN